MAYSRQNYKRTVHCSYCHEKGHNKSSCPGRKERIEELRALHGDEHYSVRQYDRKKARQKATGSNRKCSYCSEGGHNRATCTVLKEHMAETKVKNSEFRKAVYKSLCDHGIGIGAIVSSDNFTRTVNPESYSDGVYRVPQVVVNINWAGINTWNREVWYFDSPTTNPDGTQQAPIFTLPFDRLSQTHGSWKNAMGYPFDEELLRLFLGAADFKYLADGSHWRAKHIGNHFLTVESPVPPTAPPAGWLESEDKRIKHVYEQRKSWQGAI